MKCPQCQNELEVRLTKAPAMQSGAVSKSGSIGEALGQIDDAKLNKWEADFIGQLRERYEQYGDRTRLSDKQQEILDRIVRGE